MERAIVLSYRKAKRQKEWEDVIAKHKEGDVVSGLVTRKIKGGLLVNIGVNVFLPSSQVDIRRPGDIGEFLNKTIQCKILKIDEVRRNIVVSRRALLEDQRAEAAEEEPPRRPGRGADSQGRRQEHRRVRRLRRSRRHRRPAAHHRHELGPGQQPARDGPHRPAARGLHPQRRAREGKDRALSLKHKTPSPWANVSTKYPIGSRHTGEVVNVMSYGAFVKLEPGIEGLVHISEMSWTKRINHPSELVSIGDQLEVQVLNINKDKQEISLGIKQVQPNPWDKVVESYPKDTIVTGIVRNLTNYGAFVEIEEGIDGLLHVSDMSWVRKVAHPSEVVAKGDKVTCIVLNVDQERKRIALGLKQMNNDPWEGDIPGRYKPGELKKGKVTKLTNFGVFVELEPGLEGLLHISELSDQKVETPEDVVKVGDEIEVKVLRVDVADRKIGLSRKKLGVQGDCRRRRRSRGECRHQRETKAARAARRHRRRRRPVVHDAGDWRR